MELYQGDCLEILPDIETGSIDAIITDPPYGTTNCAWDSIIDLDKMWEQAQRIIKPNGAIVLFCSQPFTSVLISSNLDLFKYCWVWDKGQGTGFLNSKKQPLKSCEDIAVFYKKQCTYNPQFRSGYGKYRCKQGKTKTKNYGNQTGALTISNGERFPLSKLEFTREKTKLHPTQKPVKLLDYLIRTYTNKGEIVLDFTMGSGTTGIASKLLSRDFIGIEKDTKYFKIAEERINSTTKSRRLFFDI